ncbi:MAG TPA: hypothetical protein P5511_00580 [Candidatus Goldiibacteriota bacterium]|nr:hypothetical protein [Candidatus Goldiibacteriota bacterium]
MRSGKIVTRFLIIIVSALLLLAGCAAKPETKQMLKERGLLCSFETLPSETAIGDFDWETNGYVKLEQFKKYASNGKFTAQAIFSVPTDFMPADKAAKVKSWISAMTLSISTLTRLKVTDWSKYKKFGVDVYVPDEAERKFYIKLLDSNGKEYVAERPVKNGRNKLEIILQEVKDSRVDTASIVSLSLFLDNKGVEKDVTLFIDNVRLMP